MKQITGERLYNRIRQLYRLGKPQKKVILLVTGPIKKKFRWTLSTRAMGNKALGAGSLKKITFFVASRRTCFFTYKEPLKILSIQILISKLKANQQHVYAIALNNPFNLTYSIFFSLDKKNFHLFSYS